MNENYNIQEAGKEIELLAQKPSNKEESLMSVDNDSNSMKKKERKRVKRLSAELVDDDVTDVEILETILRSSEMGSTKIERDTALIKLSIKALSRVVRDCSKKTGKRFPDASDVAEYLKD